MSPEAARTGVGTRLFASSEQAATEAGLSKIEAFIGKDNAVAQAYYERMGFETFRQTEAAVCKVWARQKG
ncbi:GNAT family N-acetyltransferase [Rhizobium populisoli]|uniref:GNAT family N-acetyltransferase n=1 Tax=Rhizobium populisoli TaxID=2859785 RepID=UPI0028AA8BB2|nr:GNAT family N-acetyltransferase [Rhizobium populisoli]